MKSGFLALALACAGLVAADKDKDGKTAEVALRAGGRGHLRDGEGRQGPAAPEGASLLWQLDDSSAGI